MPNAKDLKPDAISTIIVGDPKSGKTYCMKTWPKPMFVFSFDGGVASLAGEDIDYEIFVDSDRYRPLAYTNFEKKFDEIAAAIRAGQAPYKTIALDNVTFLARSVLNYIQYTNRTIDKPVGYDGYRMLLNKLSDTVVKARALGVHLVLTVESKTDKDEVTGEIETVPAIEGSYRDSIVAEFDLALFCKVGRDMKDPRKPRYYWQTAPDHRIKCAGSRWDCGLSVEEVPNFGQVLKKIEQRFPHLSQRSTRQAVPAS